MNQAQNEKQLFRSKSFVLKSRSNGMSLNIKDNKQKTNQNKAKNNKPQQNNSSLSKRESPNTKRTLNPSLLDEVPYRPMIRSISLRSIQSSGVLSPYSHNAHMYYKDNVKEKTKIADKRSYQSFRFTDKGEIEPVKRAKKSFVNPNHDHSLFSEGIKDKVLFHQPNELLHQARSMKFNSDFSSKISCLPGTYTREIKEETKPLRRHNKQNEKLSKSTFLSIHSDKDKNQDRDINWFRTSKKITHNLLEESKEVRDEGYAGKRHVHPGIKNEFKSHFILG